MEHTQDLNLIEPYAIDDHEGAPGNHQLSRSAHPSRAAEIGVVQQIFNTLPDTSGHRLCRRGIVLPDIIACVFKVCQCRGRPFNLHVGPTGPEASRLPCDRPVFRPPPPPRPCGWPCPATPATKETPRSPAPRHRIWNDPSPRPAPPDVWPRPPEHALKSMLFRS